MFKEQHAEGHPTQCGITVTARDREQLSENLGEITKTIMTMFPLIITVDRMLCIVLHS